ncbi:SGNH/GDSL hydrolase family protein [Ekhidna sp.]
MKIVIIGNSVALRVRPHQKHPNNKNYTQLLRDLLGSQATVENRALGASTVSNWLVKSDEIINTFPNVYIVNIGVVDASTREVPLWFNRLATKKVDTIVTKLFKSIYNKIIIPLRPFFVRLRGKKSWVSHRKFKVRFELLISLLLKETNAQLILMPINIANGRVEKQLPGTKEKHKKYNELIKATAEKFEQQFLDLSDFKSEIHYPDGVHFSKEGHQVVAKRLKAMLYKSDLL